MMTIQSSLPWLWTLPLTALVLFFPAVTFGTAIYAAAFETAGWAKKKTFLSKLARQCLNLSLSTGLIALLLPGAILATMLSLYPLRFPWPAIWPLSPYYALAVLVTCLGLVLLVLASVSWKACRKARWLRILLCGLGGVHLAAGLYTAGNAVLLERTAAVPMAGGSVWLDPFYAHFPLLAGGSGLLLAAIGLGGAGSLGLAYLVWRRNKDDFGRDYYRYALPRLVPGTLFLPLQLAGIVLMLLAFSEDPVRVMQNPFVVSSAGTGLGLCLLAIALAWRVRLSQTPMRHKPSMITTSLLTWLSLVAFLSAGVTAFWVPLASFLGFS